MEPRRTPTVIEFRVRYAETDQMGVVYYANYLVWCEMGRTDLFRQRGSSYADLEKSGIMLAVAEANVRYHAPAFYDNMIRVETWVEEVRSRSVRFGYQISRTLDDGDTERLATAWTTLVALGPDLKMRTLSPETIEQLRDDPSA